MSKPTTVPYGFLGNGITQGAKVALLSVPYDSTTSYRAGSRHGPAAIIEASRNMETFDETLGVDLGNFPVLTLEPLEPVMTGPEAMIETVEAAVKEQLEDGKFVITLGGEHSITAGCARAYKNHFNDITFLHLDAHADLRDEYEGTPYSHACAGMRLHDLGHISEVGIRSLSYEESLFIKQKNINIVWAREIIASKDKEWMEKAISSLGNNVYVTIDLDVFDPAIMPATGTPEPGGLLYHHVTDLLEFLVKSRNVIGFDIMELAPIGGLVAPDFLAARLILRFIGLLHKSGKF
ncbi:MAG: agmatinase [Deltaproteobacteria bacterium]|nr:agmatinase [Deltaproteobacteria bacterium]